jgi:hypothetical protein
MDANKNYRDRLSTISETSKTPFSEQMNLEFDERPYLIVDLRDKDEFKVNHIVSGNFFRFFYVQNTIILSNSSSLSSCYAFTLFKQ